MQKNISIIVATSENRVIGLRGDLPWNLPADLKRFHDLTVGNIVVMGRITYESIKKKFDSLFPDRENIVLSKTLNSVHNAMVLDNVEDVLQIAKREQGKRKVFIIGGEETYNMFLPYADTIYLTLIHKRFEGDAFFPQPNRQEWQEVDRQTFLQDEKNLYNYFFITYERREKVVDLTHTKNEEYKRILKEIQDGGKCPFCPENFNWHPDPILKESSGWFITKNAFSYPEAEFALLIIPKTHKEKFEELTADDFINISFLVKWAIKEFNIKGGGFTIRFGDSAYTGATVCHIHAHLIVPKVDPQTKKASPVVYFPIG